MGKFPTAKSRFSFWAFSVGAKIHSVFLRLVLVPLLAAVGLAAEVTVVRLSKEAQVPPGAVVVHIWEITNVGETALSLRLTIEAPTGWEVLGVPTELLLPPNSSEHVFATILVPKTAAAGAYSVRLKVAWNGKEEVGEGPLVVRGVAALELRPPRAAAAQPGETLSTEVLLINRGNAVDRVTMEAWTAAGWPVRVKPVEVPLAPGEGKTVRVEVEIPQFAEPGRAVVFVRARSGLEPAVEARIAWYITVLPPGPERVVGTVLAELAMKAYGRFSAELFAGGVSSYLGVSGRGTVLDGALDLNLRFSGPWGAEPYQLLEFFARYDRPEARMEAGRVGLSFSPLLFSLGFRGLLGELSLPQVFFSFGSGWEAESGRAGGVLRLLPEWGELGGAYREERSPDLHSQASTIWLLLPLSQGIALRLEAGAGRAGGLTRFAGLTQFSVNVPDLFFGELRGFAVDPGFPSLVQGQAGFLLSGRLGAEAAGVRFSVGLSRDNIRGLAPSVRRSSTMQLAWDLAPEDWPVSLRLGLDLRRILDERIPPSLNERTLRAEVEARFLWENFAVSASGAWTEYRDFVAEVSRFTTEYRQRVEMTIREDLGAVVELKERSVWAEAGLISAEARAALEIFASYLRASFEYGKEGGALRASFEWTPSPGFTLSPAAEASWDAGGNLTRFLFSLGFSHEFGWTPPFLPVKGWLSGRVFADLDGDGEEDPAEPGVAQAVLAVAGLRVSSGKDGAFKFPPLPPGNYEVRVESAPAGYALPPPKTVQILLAREISVNLALTPLSRISGLVFQDLNANGVLDPGEPGFARAMLRLVFPDRTSQEILTNQAGRFFFPDLRPGKYRVELVLAALPARVEVTTNAVVDVEIGPGEAAEIAFGVRERPRPVILIQPPLAEFTWSPHFPRVGEPVRFDGTRSVAFAATIVSYVWDFDADGAPDAEGSQVTWTFAAPGLYLVELRVTDGAGLTGVVQYLVEVKP